MSPFAVFGRPSALSGALWRAPSRRRPLAVGAAAAAATNDVAV